MSGDTDLETISALKGKRIAFVGKLGGMSRREAFRLLRQHDAIPWERLDDQVELVVIGAEQLPLDDDALLDEATRDRAAAGELEILSETELWNRLGLVDNEQNVRRLYTPAMLADLLKVPVSIIRRWHRRGVIIPVREVHRLPYFDFHEVATARRLAELLAAGASPDAIEKKLGKLSQYFPDVERPLAQLSVITQGRELLLRQGEGLIEPGGQMRIDFDAVETCPPKTADAAADTNRPAVLPMAQLLSEQQTPHSQDEMLHLAVELEEEGNFQEAIEMYRAALVAGGVSAELSFRLAELLYLTGDVTAARERYSVAVELDEDFVEARASLGCVLAETGEIDLAIAAFRGALRFHPDYPDVHYHLARTLDDAGETIEAEEHWRAFLQLAPESPWADEARSRLGISFED